MGAGGRNAETVLRWAIELDELTTSRDKQIDLSAPPGMVFLSGGTDGIDGNSPAAGALADRLTLTRARDLRLDARRFLDTIPHESTKQTGIKHLDMTISMARKGPPGSANGNFFITVGAAPWMDWSARARLSATDRMSRAKLVAA